MASIPAFLYFGNYQANGGESSGRAQVPIAAVGGLTGMWGAYRNNWKLSKVIPSGTDGETGGAYNPYWDGKYLQSYVSTGATSTTVTVSGATWTTNALAGKTLTTTAGTGSGQTRTIASNTQDTITVTVAWSTNPTSTTFNVGRGQWVSFHYAHDYNPATLAADVLGGGKVAGAYGDLWYAEGGAVTQTALLMYALSQRYPASPGFRLIKSAADGGFGYGSSQWNTAGTGYAAALTVTNNAKSMLASGDTLDVKVCVIDCSDRDIDGFAASPATYLSYKATVTAFVAGIRASFGSSTTKVVIVNPHKEMLNSGGTANGAYLLRELNRQLADELDGVYLFDMGWATSFWPNGVLGSGANPSGWRYYSSEDYLQAGARLGNKVDAILAASPTDLGTGPLPCVVMLGDSQFVGVVDPQFAVLSQDESLLGPVGGTVREGQYIWNHTEQEWQLADVLANPNTFGTSSANIGPEQTLLKRLYERFPGGCAVFKYALNGVALTTEADADGATGAVEPAGGAIWASIETEWSAALTQAMVQLGRPLACVGLVSCLGGNDAVSADGAAAFVESVGTFVDDARDLFTTDPTGVVLPVAWLQPPPHVDAGGNSVHNTADEITDVRGAIASLATSKERCTVLLNTGASDYELSRADAIHYGGQAIYKIGTDLGESIVDLIDATEGGTTSTSTLSGAAAFTVEDGSGLTSSNSYCTVAFATTFHEQFGNPAAWTDAGLAAQQNALREATRAIDALFGLRWSGSRTTSTQALDWPRMYAVDSAGNLIESDDVPTALERVTALLALQHLNGETLVPQVETEESVRSQTLTSASGASKSVTYAGAKSPSARFPMAERMLAGAGLISGGGGWGWAYG